ncbi:hypothetical protein Y032_0011g1505 [Ancylostoma ceylanicum]|uniref:Uncharacterized protein n=1 Tax=Ancylostoma ceylanicum TaxID=53326 RepID=A0A016VFD4_9BILA|nr:hypothetical protein Y032_0011g1505 [Ancylostoma ceylanicum]
MLLLLVVLDDVAAFSKHSREMPSVHPSTELLVELRADEPRRRRRWWRAKIATKTAAPDAQLTAAAAAADK